LDPVGASSATSIRLKGQAVNDNSTDLTRDAVTVHSTSVKGLRGSAWHIELADKHYVISAIDNEFGQETMAFAADENGHVTSWTEQAVVFSQDHEACITKLIDALNGTAR